MIRKLEKEDLDDVMRIWLEGNIEAHSFIPEDDWISNYEMVREMISQAEVYISEEKERMKGFIGIEDGYVAGIFVDKKYRSEGIGKTLLECAKSKYTVLSLNVYSKNKRAVSFYLREGFTVSEEKIDEPTKNKEYTMTWSR